MTILLLMGISMFFFGLFVGWLTPTPRWFTSLMEKLQKK